jgi:YebC/PmpR family DNA-binding regulatory protein
MSGHSKWHNIRIRKGKQDAEKGRLFTKLAREIIVAAKEGGGNPDANLRLKMAVTKAREASMPADKIKQAIQRGTGEIEGLTYEEVTYEGYGPAGVAVMVKCLTDNRNRTVSEVRNVFSKRGGNLGESGCVSWVFEQKGLVSVDRDSTSEDALMSAAIDAGAEDIRLDEETYDVVSDPQDFEAVKAGIEGAQIPYISAEITMLPKSTVKVEGKDAAQALTLMENLEELDDVQQVYANFDIPESVMEEIEAGR